MNTWESASKIDGYVVYDGFMEEVIFNGQDNSSSGSVQFSFDQAVTLFNLDFCNKITSPQEYRDSEGVYVKKHKFELIDKILEFQKGVSADNQRFVLFLTINAGYDGAELSEYCTVNHDELTVYNQCPKDIKKQFILKHFVESVLYEKFCSKEFIPYFLPTVFYNGKNGVNMMQFAIMCISPDAKLRTAGVFTHHQKKQEIVNRHPIVPDCDNDTFVNYERVVDDMNDSNVDFMSTFCSSSTHKKYWVQKG